MSPNSYSPTALDLCFSSVSSSPENISIKSSFTDKENNNSNGNGNDNGGTNTTGLAAATPATVKTTKPNGQTVTTTTVIKDNEQHATVVSINNYIIKFNNPSVVSGKTSKSSLLPSSERSFPSSSSFSFSLASSEERSAGKEDRIVVETVEELECEKLLNPDFIDLFPSKASGPAKGTPLTSTIATTIVTTPAIVNDNEHAGTVLTNNSMNSFTGDAENVKDKPLSSTSSEEESNQAHIASGKSSPPLLLPSSVNDGLVVEQVTDNPDQDNLNTTVATDIPTAASESKNVEDTKLEPSQDTNGDIQARLDNSDCESPMISSNDSASMNTDIEFTGDSNVIGTSSSAKGEITESQIRNTDTEQHPRAIGEQFFRMNPQHRDPAATASATASAAFFDDEYESPDDDEYESPAAVVAAAAAAAVPATAPIPVPTESNPSNVPITHAERQSRNQKDQERYQKLTGEQKDARNSKNRKRRKLLKESLPQPKQKNRKTEAQKLK